MNKPTIPEKLFASGWAVRTFDAELAWGVQSELAWGVQSELAWGVQSKLV